MTATLYEWVLLIARWLHVMAGIAWIGTSFYFNWFDSLVRKTDDKTIKENPRGTLEEIHGGSFYYHEQYWPDTHPKRLLVHAWPAKTTFLSGLFLLATVYWVSSGTYMVGSWVKLSQEMAIAISAGSIALCWLIYNSACNRISNDKIIFGLMATVVLISAFGFQMVFGGRAAYVSVGAMLGSMMGLNVWWVIVPNHIAMRQQLKNGDKLDIHHGYLAKRRSQHNNYFTLPVVVTMISNHFPTAFQHEAGWLILSLIMLSGWAIRHAFNVLYKEERRPTGWIGLIVVSFLIAIGISLYREETVQVSTAVQVSEFEVVGIMQKHCTQCHSDKPTFPGFEVAPQGLSLDTVKSIIAAKEKVILRATVTNDMPLGNLTEMTDEERGKLKYWLENN